MKTMSSLVIYCTLFLCAIIFFSLNSCSKQDEVSKTETINFSTEKSQYAPHEIVIFSTGENIFSATTQSGKINGVDIDLTIDGNKAAFVLPDFENGTYNLTFSLGNKSYYVPVKVTALTSISSADNYFSEMKSHINDNISDLSISIAELETKEGNTNEVQALQNDLIFYQNKLNNYTSQYNSLSSEDKILFAETIAANKAILDEYEVLTTDFNQNALALRTNQNIQDYETQVEISTGKFVASVIYTVGHIPFILAGGKVAAASAGNPGVLLALGVVVTSFMINVINTATLAQTLTIKSLKPYEFIMESGQKIFQTGVESVENTRAKYRSLINSDGGNTTITTIVDTYNSLMEKYNNFRNSLPSIFRPSYLIKSLKNSFTSTTRSVYNQYINITNVSNPNVTLQKIAQSDGSIKLKATTTATTDQTFTYDVNYSNSNFTSGLKNTVNAKVFALIDSIPIYKASALGKYKVNGHVGNGPNSRLFCELKSDGVATYTIYDDPSWADGTSWNVSWSIQKQNNKYYYLDYWFNGNYNIKIDSPLSFPVKSFNYHNNTSYVK